MSRLSKKILPGALCLVAASMAFPVSAEVVSQYEYQPDRIYPVRTGLGITTQIELSPNEKILDYSTGFSTGWDLTRRENVFYLKPKNVDVDIHLSLWVAYKYTRYQTEPASDDALRHHAHD